MTTAETSPNVLLTPRELQVLQWVFQGKINRDIGQILGVSLGTIKHHMWAIMEKLGVETREAASYEALKRRILKPPHLEDFTQILVTLPHGHVHSFMEQFAVHFPPQNAADLIHFNYRWAAREVCVEVAVLQAEEPRFRKFLSDFSKRWREREDSQAQPTTA